MKIINKRNILLFFAVFAVLDLLIFNKGGSGIEKLMYDLDNYFFHQPADYYISDRIFEDILDIIGKIALAGLIIFIWQTIENRFLTKKGRDNLEKLNN